MERTKKITLETPIKGNGTEYSEINLRAPRLGERRKAEMAFNGGVTPVRATQYQATLISLVSGVPESVLDQMDADQFSEAVEFVEGFISRGPKIGSE